MQRAPFNVATGQRAAAMLLIRTLLSCLLLHTTFCDETECNYDLKPLWLASLRNSPLMATPIFFDVDGDGYGDIVEPSFSGEVWSVHGENGHIVDNWPFYLENRAFYASPLVYDVDRDGVLEFLLTTSDAEILFVHTNNSLLHGETIKIPPLRVRRHWYQLEQDYLKKLVDELSKQLGDSERLKVVREERNDKYWLILQGTDNIKAPPPPPPPPPQPRSPRELHKHSAEFSEFDSHYGRHADPLYSRHQPRNFNRGLDPQDPEIVYVDPHVMATPTLADIDGDGVQSELVVPVTFYFEPFFYGDPHNLQNLGGLDKNELQNFVAGGIVVVDLARGTVSPPKLLGLTQAGDTQPAHALATPTVVRMFPGFGDTVIIVATATGELHMLKASTLESEPGFPVSLDSISSEVAVADLFQNGALELVVGDTSGNIYCIDMSGKTLWEVETREVISSSPRFADINNDSTLDIIVVTELGSLWVLHATTGQPFPGYPIRLNTHTQSPPLLIHLSHSSHTHTLTALIPTMRSLIAVDLASRCIHTVPSDHVLLSVQTGDIDPYSPGIEILATSLDGHLLCFATRDQASDDYHIMLESWSTDTLGHGTFTHKSSSFVTLVPGFRDTQLDISGNNFKLDFEVLDNGARRSKQFSATVSVGQKYLLLNTTLPAYERRTPHSLLVPTPPEPISAFLTVTVCNEYLQCEANSRHVRFNFHFQDSLQWFIFLPFFFLTMSILWLLRDADFQPLPGAGATSSARKHL